MDIYTQIKRQNGEAFAKAIRNYDNGIFDIPGIVDMLKYAGREAEVLMNYLVSLKNIHIQEQEIPEDPIELLDKAGYDAYVVTALTDDENPNFDSNDPKTWVGQNTIQCYYAPEEKLCTFRDPHRFEEYDIINAVKQNVENIKRGTHPKREDEYGTSVISIQVLKKGGFISIKNRYNHTVENPDNTFGSNPDNIILGLSDAIRHRFGVDFSSPKVLLPKGFIQLQDQEGKDRIVWYHTEKNGYYFGPSCYVKNGVLTKVEGHEILLEHFVLNLKDGTVKDVAGTNDALSKLLKNAISGKKIQITKDKDGVQHLLADDQNVLTMKDGRLISMNIPSSVTEIGRGAFVGCSKLTSVDIPTGVTKIGEWAFAGCFKLTSIKIPDSITEIGDETFMGCSKLTSIKIPDSVTKIGGWAFSGCTSLTSIKIPDSVTEIGWKTFSGCTNLTSVHIPSSVTEIGEWAFDRCEKLSITCATKEQEAMIRKSGFKGPINIAPKAVSQQPNVAGRCPLGKEMFSIALKQLTLERLRTFLGYFSRS